MSADPVRTACPVLFEDGSLLVVDKPSGVLSHPNNGETGSPDRCAFIGKYDEAQRRFSTPAGPVWLIHRLDEDTSGILLAAKSQNAAAACRLAFEEDRVRKHYLALVRASGLRKEGAWLDHLITSTSKGKARTQVRANARPNAELHYRTLGENTAHRLALIDIDLYTGRTHQIRVQSASRRHEVCGDDVYGDFTLNRELRRAFGLRRLFLHAWKLEIIHPVTRKKLTLHSPLPADLTEVVAKLGITPPAVG